MKEFYYTADTPLSALFRRKYHNDLRQVINSWRPYLEDCPSDTDPLVLTRFDFDLKQITAKKVYVMLIDLIDRRALSVSIKTMAYYLFEHSNLSSTPSTLYQLLVRYRNESLDR